MAPGSSPLTRSRMSCSTSLTQFSMGRSLAQAEPRHHAHRDGGFHNDRVGTTTDTHGLERKHHAATRPSLAETVPDLLSERSLSCSLSCSSPASSTVHRGLRRTVTCIGGRWWTCGNAEQRTLNPWVRCSGPLRLLPIWRGGHPRTRAALPVHKTRLGHALWLGG
jgi:hypothetical protein